MTFKTAGRMTTTRKAATLVCLALGLTYHQLQAHEQPPGFTLNPAVGYYSFGSDRNLDDDMFLSLGLGYQFNSPWAIEFNWLMLEADADNGGGDVDVDEWRLDGLYHFKTDKYYHPYIAVGLGMGEFDTDFGDDDETQFNIGGGLKFFLNQALSVRTDLRLINSLDESETDLALSVGLHYTFGQRTQQPKRTKMSVLDADNDGVDDSLDRCPSTPAGTQVDDSGCPLDDDRDGVANMDDQCPNSSPDTQVDERGCHVKMKPVREMTLNVTFENDSTEVRPEYVAEIEKVARFMREHPQTHVSVEGHTDDRGDEAYNQDLSEKRAAAVAKVLTKNHGIDPRRVSSTGYGETRPIVLNSSEKNRAKNRRVVAIISAAETAP